MKEKVGYDSGLVIIRILFLCGLISAHYGSLSKCKGILKYWVSKQENE